ncbi:hypothetical protein BroCaecum321_48090 [Escherichia coli]
MAVVKCKPTSPGRRHVVKVVNPEPRKATKLLNGPLLRKKDRKSVV